jgi:two-component system, NtrC family, C4-dicarboxylate transport sensor histidine kinase DctB
MTEAPPNLSSAVNAGLPLRAKFAIAFLIMVAIGLVLVSNRLLTERYTADTRNRAELRLALYTGNLMAELQRTSVVPLLLARDPDLVKALKEKDFSQTSAKLIALQSEIGVLSIRLLDTDGRVVGATNRTILGAKTPSSLPRWIPRAPSSWPPRVRRGAMISSIRGRFSRNPTLWA